MVLLWLNIWWWYQLITLRQCIDLECSSRDEQRSGAPNGHVGNIHYIRRAQRPTGNQRQQQLNDDNGGGNYASHVNGKHRIKYTGSYPSNDVSRKPEI